MASQYYAVMQNNSATILTCATFYFFCDVEGMTSIGNVGEEDSSAKLLLY